jgi:hypothetical protein
LSGIDFDLGFTYFLYPGEVNTTGTDYWEYAVRADKKLTYKMRVAASFGYSPNISNAGAWSKYTAAGIRVDLPTPTWDCSAWQPARCNWTRSRHRKTAAHEA